MTDKYGSLIDLLSFDSDIGEGYDCAFNATELLNLQHDHRGCVPERSDAWKSIAVPHEFLELVSLLELLDDKGPPNSPVDRYPVGELIDLLGEVIDAQSLTFPV